MKKIVISVAIAAVVVFLAVTYFLSNLNSIVAEAIEKNGSEVTATKVGVAGVDISLREGRGSISGLSIASPEGYDAREAFSLGDITTYIDGQDMSEGIPIDFELVAELALGVTDDKADVSQCVSFA